MRIAEYHTYFVGASDWGFSVWAHNAEYSIRVGSNGKFEIVNSKGELIGDALDKLEDAELLAKKFNDQEFRENVVLDPGLGLCPRIKPPGAGARYPCARPCRAFR